MDELTLQVKSMELAISANHLFPSFQLHELARKFKYYIINNEWPTIEYGLDVNRNGQEGNTEISSEEPDNRQAV